MNNYKSYKNKINDIGLKSGTFKGDDGKDIDYNTVVLKLNIDGNIEEISLSGKNAVKPALLKALLNSAKSTDAKLLDDED